MLWINRRPPAVGGGVSVVSGSDEGFADSANNATMTFTYANVQAAQAGDIVVLCITGHGSSTPTCSGITIDGNAMTLIRAIGVAGGNDAAQFFAILRSSVSSGAVVVTRGSTTDDHAVKMFTVRGASGIPGSEFGIDNSPNLAVTGTTVTDTLYLAQVMDSQTASGSTDVTAPTGVSEIGSPQAVGSNGRCAVWEFLETSGQSRTFVNNTLAQRGGMIVVGFA